MFIKRLSLQIRIFLSMLLVVIIALLLIIAVTIFQYQKQAHNYHIKRLERKENAIKRDINYELRNTTWMLETSKLPNIFRDKIYEIADVHGLEVYLYDLNGRLLKTSRANLTKDFTLQQTISKDILATLKNKLNHRLVKDLVFEGKDYKSSYSYIFDNKFTPIGVLNISYLQESQSYRDELRDFLSNIYIVFFFVFLFAAVLAYFLSRYITQSIKTVIDKMNKTRFTSRNEKIEIKGGSEEIHNLVNAYNSMIDQLEESAVKLAKSEREHAWREMAKQVAHEIKNPLTPMRLSVQSFQRKFDPSDPDSKEKVAEFSQTVIQQIDTMTSIASAFSDFAKMPTSHKEPLNVVAIVKNAIDIFSGTNISFFTDKANITAYLDKTQLVRVITNLITNANQALADTKNPKIEVHIKDADKEVEIRIADNGKGIPNALKDRVFEPRFTTKSSGMGLGLPMVKNIVKASGGSIRFFSEETKGTVFIVRFPKGG